MRSSEFGMRNWGGADGGEVMVARGAGNKLECRLQRFTGRGQLTRREAKSVGEFALALFGPTTELTGAGPPASLRRFRAPRFTPRWRAGSERKCLPTFWSLAARNRRRARHQRPKDNSELGMRNALIWQPPAAR